MFSNIRLIESVSDYLSLGKFSILLIQSVLSNLGLLSLGKLKIETRCLVLKRSSVADMLGQCSATS